MEKARFLLHGERFDARARIARVPQEAPDSGGRIHRAHAILGESVECLPDGRDNVPHETPAPAASEQISDEAADVLAGHRCHRFAAEAWERIAFEGAQIERLRADAELTELRVRR